MVLSELLNTACKIDRDYKISSHVKNMMVLVGDAQPLVIVILGYYKYASLLRYLVV
jgi:hypothetical protein